MVVSKKASPDDMGQMLVDAKIITEAQLNHARELQEQGGEKIERVLIQQRLITLQQLALFTSL